MESSVGECQMDSSFPEQATPKGFFHFMRRRKSKGKTTTTTMTTSRFHLFTLGKQLLRESCLENFTDFSVEKRGTLFFCHFSLKKSLSGTETMARCVSFLYPTIDFMHTNFFLVQIKNENENY